MSWDGVSASSISTSPVSSGCHILKMDGYSQTTKLLWRGRCATSCEFEAAGQPWRINYYPNGKGHESGDVDYISLFINFAGNVGTANIIAKIRFSLVPHQNHNDEPSTPYAKSFTAQYQGSQPQRHHYDRGVSLFVKREELEKSEYLVDDCFAVCCDIDVVKISAVADPKVKEEDLERLALPCTCPDQLCKRLHPPAPAVEDVDPASLKDGDDNKKSPAASSGPKHRRRGVKAALFRLFGCGQI